MEHHQGTLEQGKEPPNAQIGPCNELRLMDEHVLMANVEDNTGYGTLDRFCSTLTFFIWRQKKTSNFLFI